MIKTKSREQQALLALRVLVSGLIAAHGWARWIAGGVVPFGDWLDAQGLPLGFGIAVAVTAIEIVGTPLLALGRGVFYLCLVYAGIYLAGILMVHAPEGWFVVGLGRNGMEYSVLLIVCLLSVAYQHQPTRNSVNVPESVTAE